PLHEFLRLEPTSRPTPKGGPDIRGTRPIPLDDLLNIRSYGNKGFCSNEVILGDGKELFQRFSKSTRLSRKDSPENSTAMAGLLPLGVVRRRDGGETELVREGEDVVGGPPAVAVSHSIEILSDYCIGAATRSLLV